MDLLPVGSCFWKEYPVSISESGITGKGFGQQRFLHLVTAHEPAYGNPDLMVHKTEIVASQFRPCHGLNPVKLSDRWIGDWILGDWDEPEWKEGVKRVHPLPDLVNDGSINFHFDLIGQNLEG